MGSYTPNYGLYKPNIGETRWGDKVNKNFDIIDTELSKKLDKSGGTLEGDVYTKNVNPVNNEKYSIGSIDNKYLNVYAKNVYVGDLVLFDLKCAKCGKAFSKGDIIVFEVVEVTPKYIRVLPIHISCKGD